MRQGLPGPDMFVQGVWDILHGDVGGAVFHLEVMNPGDVGMVQADSESGLPLEGFQVLGVVGDGLVDDLDCHHTVQRGIPGTVDRPLATSGYPFEDFVSADSLKHRCCRGL